MPGCARIPDRLLPWLMLTALLLSACSDPVRNDRFETRTVEARWSNGWLELKLDQRLAFSGEARDALVHGVPLTIELELSLREMSSPTRIANRSQYYEIRFLPMSSHYQLSLPDGSVKTFPRLRHVLAELAGMDIAVRTGPLPAGAYELLVRTRLDRRRMPPPMKLPVMMSAEWRHDSNWSAWPLDIDPGA